MRTAILAGAIAVVRFGGVNEVVVVSRVVVTFVGSVWVVTNVKHPKDSIRKLWDLTLHRRSSLADSMD